MLTAPEKKSSSEHSTTSEQSSDYYEYNLPKEKTSAGGLELLIQTNASNITNSAGTSR